MEEPAVLHEDDRLVAVDKRPGELVVPGRGVEGEPLVAALSRRLGAKAFVVHRLDREASGVVVFAKDAGTHRRLCALFETRAVSKRYLALVRGPLVASGTIDLPLKAFGSGRMGAGPGGKPSTTRWRALKTLPDAALVEAEPLTGRRHQIRVHLWNLGHPILGDPLYGKDRPVGGASRLMLHAWTLVLPEPFGLTLRAEPPEDFRREYAARGGGEWTALD